jgi:hypothetical protein
MASGEGARGGIPGAVLSPSDNPFYEKECFPGGAFFTYDGEQGKWAGSLDGIAFQLHFGVVTMIEAQQEGVDLGQGCEVFRMMIQGVFLVAVDDEENVVIGDEQIEAESIGPVLETLLESACFSVVGHGRPGSVL